MDFGESCATSCQDGYNVVVPVMNVVKEMDRSYSNVLNDETGSMIDSAQAWSAEGNEKWAELDMGDDGAYVRGVIVQGRSGSNEKVSVFDVLVDNVLIKEGLKYESNGNVKQEFYFDKVIHGKKVKFRIQECKVRCSMRMDVLISETADDNKMKAECGIHGWDTCGINVLRTVDSVNDDEGMWCFEIHTR
tara:strand:- start:187 stop:756 length:570 start_codon:yes stop_codon:yes gene_type:complete